MTLLRDIHLCNETGADATVTLSIGSDGSGKRILKDYVVPANDYRGFVGGINLLDDPALLRIRPFAVGNIATRESRSPQPRLRASVSSSSAASRVQPWTRMR